MSYCILKRDAKRTGQWLWSNLTDLSDPQDEIPRLIFPLAFACANVLVLLSADSKFPLIIRVMLNRVGGWVVGRGSWVVFV